MDNQEKFDYKSFEAEAIERLRQGESLSGENGDVSGSVFLVARAVDRAGAYLCQMAKDVLPTDEAGWHKVGNSTQASLGAANLSVGATYYFRFAAVTPDFCAPVVKIVI